MISGVKSERLSGRKGRKLGLSGLLWCLTPSWDFMTSRRLVLGLHCIPMASKMEGYPCVWLTWAEGKWLKSPTGTSGDSSWLKTSKSSSDSSSELSILTTFPFSSSSFSSLVAGWERVASSSALHWRIGSTFSTPCGLGLGLRKLGTATLISYKRGSFAFITHFDAWKLNDSEV